MEPTGKVNKNAYDLVNKTYVWMWIRFLFIILGNVYVLPVCKNTEQTGKNM